MDMHFRPATELARLVRAKEIGARELLDLQIDRIESLDGALNAVVVQDFERARSQASSLDERAAKNDFVGPLHGVPMTVKESFNVAGLPTTWGAPWARDQIAGRDAVAVEKLKSAGAVVMGKTNVPFMLMDFQSYNEIHGRTNNPWNLDRTPGGSSGGAAAALAAGFSALEFGSDIGGSIRRPANHCGVYGLKPTLQTICSRGHSPSGSHDGWTQPDLAVIGPMARHVDDIELALDLTAGPDELDAAGVRFNLPSCDNSKLAEFRVAYLPSHEIAPIDKAVVTVMDRAVGQLAQAGLKVEHGPQPAFDWSEMYELFSYLLFSVFTADMPDDELARAKAAVDSGAAPAFSAPDLISRTGYGRHADWLARNYRRARIRELWRDFFRDYDLFLCPISSTTAFPHDMNQDFDARTLQVNGEPQPFFQQSFWSGIATLAYLPALNAPCGLSDDGLPVGIQIIAPAFHEKRTIQFARLMAEELGGFQAPPDYR